MKTRKIGVVALLGIVAAAALSGPAMAQCVSPTLIKFDADVFAYESSYVNATYMSSAGSTLTDVGKIVCFGPPLSYLNANMPAKEYTFIWTLTSYGTLMTIPGKVWDTDYATSSTPGSFSIYEDSAPDAPTAATIAPNPPNADAPTKFINGTVILSGLIPYFHTQITKASNGNFGGSFNATYYFTGGTLYSTIGGNTSNLNGLWCSLGTGPGQCTLPAGYSAHPSGKNDVPTLAYQSTWGQIKQLYR